MDDETKNLIKDQYAKLPPELQEALRSANLHNEITSIGTRHQLHIDQIGLLEDEITMLMMGFTEPIEFPSILQEHVHVDADLAQKIALDVSHEILLPIREKMEGNDMATDAPVEDKKPLASTLSASLDEKSVIMPSSVAKSAEVAIAPANPATPLSTDMQIEPPVGQVPAPAPAVPAVAQVAPQPAHEADIMLSEATVSLPKKIEAPAAAPTQAAPAAPAVPHITVKEEAPKPAPLYKADPYREPIE